MRVAAATCRATHMESVVGELLAAHQTAAARMDLLHLKSRLKRQGVVLAKDLPGKVERLDVYKRQV